MRKIKFGKYKYWFLILTIVGSVSFTSCSRARYRKMIKKRRVTHHRSDRHRSKYQKRLNKRTISTGSHYYIKNERNYRRRPWYN